MTFETRKVMDLTAEDGQWHLNLRDTTLQPIGLPFSSRAEAGRSGADWCRRNQPSRLVIHDRAGRVEEQRLYGSDLPHPPAEAASAPGKDDRSDGP